MNTEHNCGTCRHWSKPHSSAGQAVVLGLAGESSADMYGETFWDTVWPRVEENVGCCALVDSDGYEFPAGRQTLAIAGGVDESEAWLHTRREFACNQWQGKGD